MDKERLYYLDWLRIGAFGLLIIFHCFRFFDFFPWHVKNAEQSEWVTQFVLFSTSWRMPLIFFVSGAGTWFALRSRGAGFLKDRISRLIVPYVFGILVLIPPQKYFEFRHYSGELLSYLEFLSAYPARLTEPDLGFSLVWLGHAGYHIWYLAYLFLMTVLLLPVLRRIGGRSSRMAVPDWATRHIVWLFVPLLVINMSLRPLFPDYLDWADFFHYLFFFLFGFVFIEYRTKLAEWVSAHLKSLIAIALLTSFATHFFALQTELMVRWISEPVFSADYLGFVAIRSSNALAWVLVLLGLSIRFLNRDHRSLQPLNEAILPVYILHQTIIVAVGFYVVQWSFGISAKAGIILLAATLLMSVCYLLVRRVPMLRIVFGMKPVGN